MAVRKPHFLLFCNAKVSAASAADAQREPMLQCRWHVVLDNLASADRIELSDRESVSSPERAELIGVVRGLESLPQPSEVTLITASPYVNKGLRYGLAAWRENDYRWEHFGSEQPIRNADLWRRIDRALQFHRVECRLIAAVSDCETQQSDQESVQRANVAEVPAEAPEGGSRDRSRASASPSIAPIARQLGIAAGAVSAAIRSAAAAAAELARVPERAVFAAEAIFDAVWLTFRGRGVA